MRRASIYLTETWKHSLIILYGVLLLEKGTVRVAKKVRGLLCLFQLAPAVQTSSTAARPCCGDTVRGAHN